MTKVWRVGFLGLSFAFLSVILSAVELPIFESHAHAGFLKNGVRSGDRTIKTIRPPRAGSRNRLKTLEERQRQPFGSNRDQPARKQQHAWFWRAYAPELSAQNVTRWNAAIKTMTDRRATGKGLVRSETVAAIDLAYREIIAKAARKHSVSEALIVGVITVESRGKPEARSHKGAQGLMQLIPATAKRFGVQDAYQPAQNIDAGVAYLDWVLREFNGDILLALAGYNAGEGAVRKHKGVPPFTETRDYVAKVMDATAAAVTLCSLPITSPRGRCVRRSASPTE